MNCHNQPAEPIYPGPTAYAMNRALHCRNQRNTLRAMMLAGRAFSAAMAAAWDALGIPHHVDYVNTLEE